MTQAVPDDSILLRQRVLAVMPDLEIEQLEINSEGTLNDVVIVNRRIVFRFARTEKYAALLERELAILDVVRPRIGVQVPTPVYMAHGCMAYPLLDGVELSRTRLLKLDPRDQENLARQIGGLLAQLHAIDGKNAGSAIPATHAPVLRQDWVERRKGVRERIYPLLQNYQIEWAEHLFSQVLDRPGIFEYKPVLIHGDLASYHLLLDERAMKITGLIDFGMAGLGDPASDFGNLISMYGETFVKKMAPAYASLDEFLPRARFYAHGLEYEWILRGLESGETFWFTAHLGNARDTQD